MKITAGTVIPESTVSQRRPIPEGDLPQIRLAIAENVLRTIARCWGEAIKKRRAGFLREQLGDGYGVVDVARNFLIFHSVSPDGYDLSLCDVAGRYEDDPENTPWQRRVIKAILEERIVN